MVFFSRWELVNCKKKKIGLCGLKKSLANLECRVNKKPIQKYEVYGLMKSLKITKTLFRFFQINEHGQARNVSF